MKTITSAILIGAILATSNLYADRHEGRDYDRRGSHYAPVRYSSPHHHNDWIAPLFIGGVLGYILSSPRQPSVTYVDTPSNVTYIQSSSVPVTYVPGPTYREEWVYFEDCDCQRKVLVPIQ